MAFSNWQDGWYKTEVYKESSKSRQNYKKVEKRKLKFYWNWVKRPHICIPENKRIAW
jgi:ribonuclease HI